MMCCMLLSSTQMPSTGLGMQDQDFERELTPYVRFVSELGGSMPFPHAPASVSSLSI